MSRMFRGEATGEQGPMWSWVSTTLVKFGRAFAPGQWWSTGTMAPRKWMPCWTSTRAWRMEQTCWLELLMLDRQQMIKFQRDPWHNICWIYWVWYRGERWDVRRRRGTCGGRWTWWRGNGWSRWNKDQSIGASETLLDGEGIDKGGSMRQVTDMVHTSGQIS